MVYKHAYLHTLLFLQSAFMLSVVKLPQKGEVGGPAINSHGNYIVDHGKSWKNHEIVLLNFFGNPVCLTFTLLIFSCQVTFNICSMYFSMMK